MENPNLYNEWEIEDLKREYEIKCEQYESEIKELKEQIENLEGMKLAQGVALEKEYAINEFLKEKSKTIIKNLLFHNLKMHNYVIYNLDEDVINSAEQFLKEIE